MEILQLLDELEKMGTEGERHWYRFPLFFLLWGKTVMDANAFFDLLGQLRQALPQEMTTASRITAERDAIIEEAHRERQKIIEAAKEQAQMMVATDNLVLEAQNRAREIIREAQVEAEAIRAEAEQWARTVVERLESYVNRIAATIEKTKRAMLGPNTASSGPPRPPAAD